MTESESRVVATEIVERLRKRGVQPFQIRVYPNGSGLTARVGFAHDLVVEAIIPPGFFSYDLVTADLLHQVQTAVIDSDGPTP